MAGCDPTRAVILIAERDGPSIFSRALALGAVRTGMLNLATLFDPGAVAGRFAKQPVDAAQIRKLIWIA
jgi:hypothetical protein